MIIHKFSGVEGQFITWSGVSKPKTKSIHFWLSCWKIKGSHFSRHSVACRGKTAESPFDELWRQISFIYHVTQEQYVISETFLPANNLTRYRRN